MNQSVRQAESILGQVRAASQDLRRREERLRDLSGTVKTVAAQLGELLNRLQKASAESRREKRCAEELHDRLISQTEQARKIVEALGRRAQAPQESTQAIEHRAVVVKTASVPADTPGGGGHLVETTPLVAGPLQGVLSRTRESLTDLRKLARASGNGRAGPGEAGRANAVAEVPDSEGPATVRLAHRVEHLVAMLDPQPVT